MRINKNINKINYKELHELCFLERDELYKINKSNYLINFSTRLGDLENDPFIGFVGSMYENAKVKVLFLGKSNAESAIKLHDKDKLINNSFKKFKNCDRDFSLNYRDYAKQYSDKISGAFWDWGITRFPNYFRDEIGLDIEEIAYANIVPYRYKKAPNTEVYRIAFKMFTNKLISIIAPNQIIPLGANLDSNIINKFINDIQMPLKISKGISREGRDKRIAIEGYRTLDLAINDYRKLITEKNYE